MKSLLCVVVLAVVALGCAAEATAGCHGGVCGRNLTPLRSTVSRVREAQPLRRSVGLARRIADRVIFWR